MAPHNKKEVFSLNTPLFGAVSAYINKDAARFHMPGHKGNLKWLNELGEYGGFSRFDITEVDGCDNIYSPKSAIAEMERRYTGLYQSAASLISAGGSTLCIQTMLALAVKPRQKLICARGCHTAAISAMALLDIEPVWVFPETDTATGLAKAVTASQIGDALEQNPGAAAVYITSPDYYGTLCDIGEIAKVCSAQRTPLLVDDAHGAYLRFLAPSKHPINLGADMCNDSLHKTLPVLTGSAMLHINNEKFIPDAKRYMSMFGSTSPSYLIMLSIDKALDELSGEFSEKLQAAADKVAKLEKNARDAGFLIPAFERDPLRLTLGFSAMGYSADEFIRLLRENKIEPEMVSGGFAIFMASPYNRPEDFAVLEKFITGLPKKSALPSIPNDLTRPLTSGSLRAAAFAAVEEIPMENAAGKVAGSVIAPCPPGVPLVVPGEVINENLILYLKNYGISRLNVLK